MNQNSAVSHESFETHCCRLIQISSSHRALFPGPRWTGTPFCMEHSHKSGCTPLTRSSIPLNINHQRRDYHRRSGMPCAAVSRRLRVQDVRALGSTTVGKRLTAERLHVPNDWSLEVVINPRVRNRDRNIWTSRQTADEAELWVYQQ
jgi:hypothetical protein